MELKPHLRYSYGYFRSVLTTVYRSWAHLIWAPKLGKPGKNLFCESKHIWCKYIFSIRKKLTTLIWNVKQINRSLGSFYSHSLSFADGLTDKSKDQAPKHCINNNLFPETANKLTNMPYSIYNLLQSFVFQKRIQR